MTKTETVIRSIFGAAGIDTRPLARAVGRTAGIFIFGTRDAWRKAGDEALVYLQSGTLRMMQTA